MYVLVGVTVVQSKENVKIKIAEPPSTSHFQSYSRFVIYIYIDLAYDVVSTGVCV